jgi:tRNA A37 threonylcarbamoyladenosine biosynthesis protein TsaE
MWRKNEEIHIVGYEKCPRGNKQLIEWNKNLANDTSDNETYLTIQNTVVSSSKKTVHNSSMQCIYVWYKPQNKEQLLPYLH